jgi:hypothetical protein|tara:strand:+ start:606 stop:908 length:303 start_codon:yes stop_codon:yes gene_type:complete
MRKSRWTDYDRYVVLSDNAVGRLRGTYLNFQDFKKVVEALTSMAQSQKTNLLFNGKLVSLQGRKITPNDANTILTNIYECKWTPVTEKMLLVANAMGLKI